MWNHTPRILGQGNLQRYFRDGSAGESYNQANATIGDLDLVISLDSSLSSSPVRATIVWQPLHSNPKQYIWRSGMCIGQGKTPLLEDDPGEKLPDPNHLRAEKTNHILIFI